MQIKDLPYPVTGIKDDRLLYLRYKVGWRSMVLRLSGRSLGAIPVEKITMEIIVI